MKIVMVDQDGVLLDKSYRTTLDVNGFFQRLPKSIMIVPNSDTPVERIANNFLASAGIRPDVVVGEKGAVIAFRGKLYTTSNVVGIKDYIERLKLAFSLSDCDIVVGDSATWIREQKRFTPNRRMLIIDGLRKQTIGFYLRTTDRDGIARLDDDWFATGSNIVRVLPLPAGVESNDFNVEYGIVIMNAIGVSKTNGYGFLRRKFPQADFYMIGDGDADVIQDPKVSHCAVGNASARLKEMAKFVSSKQFTAGLIDCLQWIMGQ